MKTVILGAGASFDSINRFHDTDFNPRTEHYGVHEWRPPLGNEIFGSRVNFRSIYESFSGAKALSHKMNSVNDVEEFFQSEWDFAEKHDDRLTMAQIINSQYAMSELFYDVSMQYSNGIGVSNYALLVNNAYKYAKATGEEVGIISFNYDILLEIALVDFYNNLEELSIDDYIKGPIKVFKPHGSCNWFREFKQVYENDVVKALLENRTTFNELDQMLREETVVSSAPFVYGADARGRKFGLRNSEDIYNQYYYPGCPQLLVPIKNKDMFVMPNEHEQEMINHITNSRDFLVIGWKGNEEHFLSELKTSLGNEQVRFTTVTGEDKTVQDNLKRALPGATFDTFIRDYHETHRERDKNIIDLYHKKGYFSSYMLNVEQRKIKGFFDINSH